MILTQPEYNDLWTYPAPHGFNQPLADMPSYHEYLQREVYQQDYLDLFKRGKTETYKRTLIRGRWYINMSTSPTLRALGIPENDLYTLWYLGNLMLLVEYDHPFKKEIKSQREIKYILIGESAFEKTIPLVGYGMIDNLNTFFYNILNTASTSYLDAPSRAFNILTNSKQANLIELADNGVVLLDIFPFAANYAPFRGGIAPMLIHNSIRRIVRLLSYPFFRLTNPKLCLICSVDHAINIIHHFPVLVIAGVNVVLNDESHLGWIAWSPMGLVPAIPNLLPLAPLGVGVNWHGLDGDACVIENRYWEHNPTRCLPAHPNGRIHRYRSIGKIMSNGIPHEIPIRFAFDLP